MTQPKASQKGFITASGIGLLLAVVSGGYIGGWSMELIGVDTFQSQSRLLGVAFAVFLTPLWALFSDLKKLKDHGDVTQRQAREIDFRVKRGINRIIGMGVFIMIGVVVVSTAGFWPKDPAVFVWFSRIAGAMLMVTLTFGVNVILNLKELHSFEEKLARLKQDKERRTKLLEQMKGSVNQH